MKNILFKKAFLWDQVWLWQLVVLKAHLKSRTWPAKYWTQRTNNQMPKKVQKNYDKQKGVYFLYKPRDANFFLVFWTFFTELSCYFSNVTLSVFDGHQRQWVFQNLNSEIYVWLLICWTTLTNEESRSVLLHGHKRNKPHSVIKKIKLKKRKEKKRINRHQAQLRNSDKKRVPNKSADKNSLVNFFVIAETLSIPERDQQDRMFEGLCVFWALEYILSPISKKD